MGTQKIENSLRERAQWANDDIIANAQELVALMTTMVSRYNEALKNGNTDQLISHFNFDKQRLGHCYDAAKNSRAEVEKLMFAVSMLNHEWNKEA